MRPLSMPTTERLNAPPVIVTMVYEVIRGRINECEVVAEDKKNYYVRMGTAYHFVLKKTLPNIFTDRQEAIAEVELHLSEVEGRIAATRKELAQLKARDE